jgi:hypothetical protein
MLADTCLFARLESISSLFLPAPPSVYYGTACLRKAASAKAGPKKLVERSRALARGTLTNAHVGRHSPSYAGTGRSHDGSFLLPVKPGGLLLPE